ncbi:TrmH family RNA methyltransferase [Planktosalinus lacus]|uniref:tRNA (guanosine(18)-2'-O)-methyltransferase n=1 Tax=Planktosalinus lacus TaxID=1526573 RepID=A0A8J2VAG3_9FLAO|nr:RNA methyltransferase [Planktosalinus lacus]GGD97370.1 tRNA (guanosine(18)-2'-O)-methyltransferase [Planktosalinus lacus]
MDTVALLKYLESYLTDKRKELFREVLKQRTRHFTVVTEDVYQLHNTSAVMRTCDIFGIQDLHVVEEIQGKRIDKEIAMGAQKWVDLYRFESIDECITSLKDKGYRIIATTPHKDSQFLDDFDVTQKAAFFFGKESTGLSDKVFKQADGFLKIPMYGFTESLNISVSAAIILQNTVSKLKKSNISWQLSEEEQLKKRVDWAKKTIKSVDTILERYTGRKK